MDKRLYKEWAKNLNSMAKAALNEDFDKANSYKMIADKLFENAMKEHKFFQQNISNFGVIAPAIENSVRKMYMEDAKKNQSVMKEYLKLMTEDKNLKAQYTFYEAMKNYTSAAPSKDYVKESLKDVKKMIDESTIGQSNQKLVNFMKKYHITKNVAMISEEKMNFYNACQFLLENKQNSNHLADMYDNIEGVANFIEKNPRQVVTEDKSARKRLIDTVNRFNSQYSMLEGKDLKIFNVLLEKKEDDDTDDVKKAKDEKKIKLLNDMKADCIRKADELAVDASEDEKAAIEEIKNRINSFVYEESTIVSSLAQLIEINANLSD